MTACRAGHRCVALDPTTRLPADAGTAALCDPCLDRAAADIAALPADYVALDAQLVPGRGGEGQRVGGGPVEAEVPINLHIEALQREIFFALTGWERPVRWVERLPDRSTGRVRDGWAVQRAARLLAPRVAILARLGPTSILVAGPVVRDGVTGLAELRALHRRARVLVGDVRRPALLPGSCSGCGAMALHRDNGSDTVWCAVCHRRWTYDDYQRYVGLMLAGP